MSCVLTFLQLLNYLKPFLSFQSIPGPGKYEIKGQFDPKPPKVNTEGIEVEHPPFGAQAKVIFPDIRDVLGVVPK